MKRKIIAVAAVGAALALCMALAGCGGSDAKSDNKAAEPTKASELTTLVVGFDSAYPPYGYVDDNGEFAGIDLDLAKEVATRNGWAFTAKPIDWDAKDAELNSGTITCIWNGFTYEGRENDYTFSEQYMLNKQVIMVKADSGIADEAGLAGKNVVTQVDSAALDVLTGDQEALAKTFGSLQEIGDYSNAVMQLESGAVDAVACDSSIADYFMAAKPGVFTIAVTLSTEHYAVGFKQGETELAQVVSDTLKAMFADGTVKTLCEKYADQGISFENWILK